MPAWRALRVVAERGGRDRGEGSRRRSSGATRSCASQGLLHATEREGRAGWSRVTGRRDRQVPARVGVPQVHRRPHRTSTGIRGAPRRTERGYVLGPRRDGPDARGLPSGRSGRDTSEVADTVPIRARPRRAPLGRASPAAPPGGGDRAQQSDELFAAWRTFFERIVEGPVVLVFEDLQWADTGLLDFIDHCSSGRGTGRSSS